MKNCPVCKKPFNGARVMKYGGIEFHHHPSPTCLLSNKTTSTIALDLMSQTPTLTLEKLLTFRSQAKPEDFERIFGKNLGERLWGKFWGRYEFDVIRFYGALDGPNREQFGQAIEEMEIP